MTMVNLSFVTQDSWTIVFLSLLHCRRSCYKLFFRKEFLKEKLRNNFYKEFLKGQHCVTTFMRNSLIKENYVTTFVKNSLRNKLRNNFYKEFLN